MRSTPMKTYLYCKACGYIAEEGELRDVCPACGVSAKMFEPYIEKMSEKRKLILDLHIHPIIVHFPQAFGVSLLLLSLLLFILPSARLPQLLLVIRTFAFSLPLFLAGAFLSGILDGKIRFHKITTPLLKIKLLFGALYILCSIAACLVIGLKENSITSSQAFLLIGISFIMLICSSLLGIFGTKLLNAKFPG